MNIIFESLHPSADEETVAVAKNLTQAEAKRLAATLNKRLNGEFINQAEEATTIQNLKRVENAISYRLTGGNRIWSNCSIAPLGDSEN